MLRINNQYLTKKDLEETTKSIEKTLEKALESQSKTILKAVDFSLGKIKNDISGVKQEMGGIKNDTLEVKQEMGGIKDDILEIKRDVVELKQNDKKVLTQQDKISKQLTDLQQENKMSFKLYQRHDKTIENHEERISKLELNVEPVL